MNFNKVIIAGHLTKDVETAFTQSGTEYAKCGIAVNNGFGENKKVCFIDFTCWGKTAKFLAKHFAKGKSIIVEGELQLDTWEKDGKKCDPTYFFIRNWSTCNSFYCRSAISEKNRK